MVQICIDSDLSLLIKNKVRVNNLKSLEIKTVQDLLQYFPRRLEPPAIFYPNIKKLRSDFSNSKTSKKCIVEAEIINRKITPMANGRGSKIEFTLNDQNDQSITATFFAKSSRYLDFLKSSFQIGQSFLVVGEIKIRESVGFVHPEMFKIYDEIGKKNIIDQKSKPTPIYSANSKISSSKIHESILTVLTKIESLGFSSSENSNVWSSQSDDRRLVQKDQNNTHQILPDLIPESYLASHKNIVPRWNALKTVHCPKNEFDFKNAFEQFKLEEALLLQAILHIRRLDRKHTFSVARPIQMPVQTKKPTDHKSDQKSIEELIKSLHLPFELTNAQKNVLEEISNEIDSKKPMRRLLQGDVGAGKTIVALLAMLQVIQNGGQVVLLAPTEVLARQHYSTIFTLTKTFFRSVHEEVVLICSSTNKKQRDSILAKVRSNQAKIIVGTHSVLSEQFEFADLGLIVVDEQQRFGVEQRDILLQVDEGKPIPHLLMLSATPIPRSVAMTVFSDLEISSIDQLPKNRQKVESFIVDDNKPNWVERMWEKVKEEVDKKNNVFIVAPRIGEEKIEDANCKKSRSSILSDDNKSSNMTTLSVTQNLFDKLISSQSIVSSEEDVKLFSSIESVQNILKKNKSVKDLAVATVHGRMKSAEIDQTMENFKQKKVNILLATSVIEVGIDIPDATIMIIFDADHFSLSTLHQLRGRVGRGKMKSWCFLLPSKSPTEIGMERLKTIVSTSDGFEIAKKDLFLRSEGDLVGKNQSGTRSSLNLLKVLQDEEIIQTAYHLVRDEKWTSGLKIAIENELDETKKQFLTKV